MSPRQLFLRALPAVVALALTATTGTALHASEPRTPVIDVAQRSTTYADLPETAVVADGPVDQVVAGGDRVYAFGGFDRVGHYTGPGRVLDAATGDDLPAPVLPDGQVSVTVPDGNGGWYVGGDFAIDNQQGIRGGLQHVLVDGSVDEAFDAGVDGLVSALELDGTTLYVGGQFNHVGDTARQNLAAVDAGDGSVLPFSADQEQRVSELLLGDGRLYVGSDLVRALDPATGEAIPGFSAPDGGDSVSALALGAGRLYIGRNYLTAVDPATGATDDGFHVSMTGPVGRAVDTLLYAGSRLYVGTDATTVGGRPGRLVALEPDSGDAIASFDPQVTGGRATYSDRGGVFDLAIDGSRLWVGGAFTRAGGESARNLAVLDADTGTSVGLDLPSLVNQVNAVDVSSDAVYVGGHFFLDHSSRTAGLAALDATTLAPVAGFHVAKRAWHWQSDLVVAPNALYLGPTHFYGYNPHVKSPPYYSDTTAWIRAFDPDTGAADTARSHRVQDLSGFTTVGKKLVVAQRLGDNVRYPRTRITVYGASGRATGTFLVPLRGYVSFLTSVQGDLLATGSFLNTTSQGYPDDTAMVRFGLDGKRRAYFNPKIYGPVYDASVQGDTVFASGLFDKVYQGVGFDRPGLTRMDATSAKSDAFTPADFSANRVLLRITALGDSLWVGGPRNKFLDATTGAVLPDPTGGHAPEITSVTRAGDALVFGSSTYGINMEGSSWNFLGYVGRVAD